MKNSFYFLILVLSAVVLACTDGQERTHKSPQEILLENKLLDSFSEKQVKFIPESYAEKTTDTIFDNGYEVHVKMYSDLNSHITVNLNDETVVNYRDFNLDIKVVKEGQIILSTTVNKEHDIAKVDMEDLDLTQYYLRDFWITNDDTHHIGVPCIYFEYYSPTLKDTFTIKLIADRTEYSKYTTIQISN